MGVFFEYAPNQPECAGQLVSVLRKSKQKVPPELDRIAEDVASGRRQSKNSWGSSSWGSRGGGSWKDGGKWSSSSKYDWKESRGSKEWGSSSNGWFSASGDGASTGG